MRHLMCEHTFTSLAHKGNNDHDAPVAERPSFLQVAVRGPRRTNGEKHLKKAWSHTLAPVAEIEPCGIWYGVRQYAFAVGDGIGTGVGGSVMLGVGDGVVTMQNDASP